MKKKITALCLAAVLAMGLTACGEKSVEELQKITLEDIEKANMGDALLDNHDSVQYRMEIHQEGTKMTEYATIAKDGDDYIYSVKMEDTENYRTEVFKDGYIYSEYGGTDGLGYAVCWFMDEEYDAYLNDCVQGFLVGDMTGLDIVKTEVSKDGKINGKEVEGMSDAKKQLEYVSVTAQIDEGDNVSEEYDYFYEYIMDTETLEIDQFLAYGVDTEDEEALNSFAQITYDEEYSEPSFVNKLEKEDKRTVTIVVDPGKSSEKKHTVEIAACAEFDAVLSDGYVLYSDKDGKTEYTVGSESLNEEGNYSDMTVYAIR